MKKQLQHQLKQLATAILEADNLSATQIKQKAQQLFEQAVVLAYAESKESITPNPLLEAQETVVANKNEEATVTEPIETTGKIHTEENQTAALPTFDFEQGVIGMNFEAPETAEKLAEIEVKEVAKPTTEKKELPLEAPALLHELEDLTKDFDLPDFEPMEQSEIEQQALASPATEVVSRQKVSLNDTLNKGFQVGLNDRLAFVNQLFNGNQEDYTRVISQLNTTETLEEAQQFIHEIVKPEYNNWEGKETFELRFMELIARNFQQ